MERLEIVIEESYGYWGPAAEEVGATCSKVGGDTFWWQESNNHGFLEDMFSTPIRDIDFCSIIVVDTSKDRGREWTN